MQTSKPNTLAHDSATRLGTLKGSGMNVDNTTKWGCTDIMRATIKRHICSCLKKAGGSPNLSRQIEYADNCISPIAHSGDANTIFTQGNFIYMVYGYAGIADLPTDHVIPVEHPAKRNSCYYEVWSNRMSLCIFRILRLVLRKEN